MKRPIPHPDGPFGKAPKVPAKPQYDTRAWIPVHPWTQSRIAEHERESRDDETDLQEGLDNEDTPDLDS